MLEGVCWELCALAKSLGCWFKLSCLENVADGSGFADFDTERHRKGLTDKEAIRDGL
jgi:hypothetical protein